MELIKLPDYIQWELLKYLEDSGFNINWRNLMMCCKYYKNLIKNTNHLIKKICPKIPKIKSIFNCQIYFYKGICDTHRYILKLNSDRRKWGDLNKFLSEYKIFNKCCFYNEYYKDLGKFNKYCGGELLIKSPNYYYTLKVYIADFLDDWMMSLVSSQNDEIIYYINYQSLEINDPISLIKEISIEDRWDLLVNRLKLEIIENK